MEKRGIPAVDRSFERSIDRIIGRARERARRVGWIELWGRIGERKEQRTEATVLFAGCCRPCRRPGGSASERAEYDAFAGLGSRPAGSWSERSGRIAGDFYATVAVGAATSSRTATGAIGTARSRAVRRRGADRCVRPVGAIRRRGPGAFVARIASGGIGSVRERCKK